MAPRRRASALDRDAGPTAAVSVGARAPDRAAAGAIRRQRAPQASLPLDAHAVRALQRQVGNRATARLVTATRGAAPVDEGAGETPARTDGGAHRSPIGRAQAPRGSAQRLLTVKDPEGQEYRIDEPGVATEAYMALSEHESEISKKDFLDFPGVYGNDLENPGVFRHYLQRLFESGVDHGTFDLGKAEDAVRLYLALKPLVMGDLAAGEEEPSPPEAEEDVGADEAPVNPAFTPANILFASVSGGKVGSIYFPAGRIRLTHDSEPEVDEHAGIERYTISAVDLNTFSGKWGRNEFDSWAAVYQWITTLPSSQQAVAGNGEILFELWPGGLHPSRGGPQPFNYNLTQRQLNIIYRAALQKDNDVLRQAMAGDQLLSTIPLN